MLCDWTRSAANCRDADFIKYMLLSSSALHLAAGIFGIWLLSYRNRGLNRKIVTELFMTVGTGIRPKPMDCIVFFVTIACFVKIPGNLVLILDVLQDALWLRIALEQLYWLFVAFAFSTYFVGLLYAMPVTTREGIFAVYRPETAFGAKPLRPIHVLTPTTVQKNAMLVIGAIYPSVFGAALGIASGALHDQGHVDASRVLWICQYANWVLIMYVMAVMFFYYGLKYTFILRANIIVAETALKAPRAAFGIGNLKSRSPARFLFIQLQITGFGGCAVTVLAGSLCLMWVFCQRRILSMKSDELPHTIAFFWTCAMAVAFFVVMILITAQSVRNRRRGLHDPSSNMSHSGGPSSSGHGGSGASQKQGSIYKSQETEITKGSKHTVSRFEQETCLTQGSSGELSTLHSVGGQPSSVPGDHDLEVVGGGHESDRDAYRVPSLTPPPRPHAQSIGSGPTRAMSPELNHSQIRESVFGGRTPREDRGMSPPQSPTATGFPLPSFPLVSLRSGSRNSMLSRGSTSSGPGTATQHTTSFSTIGSSSRLSRCSSKNGVSSFHSNHGSSTTCASPTSPTYVSFRDVQPPTVISSPPPVYNYSTLQQQQQQQQQQHSSHPRLVSQPVPQFGGAVRKQSVGSATPPSISAPIAIPASRGAGGGYRGQIETEPAYQPSPRQRPLQQQQQQLQ
ncbi:hypothetical protein BGX34_004904 [Mortierella sp. NVP85]|nr:hypothetical protein BGX34_004904 [Mortierella sp. NVP85]